MRNNFGIAVDVRVPDFGAPRDKIYNELLDMCAWADGRGFSYVNVMEHHGADDGYLPAPFVFGAAVAARTKNVKLVLGAVLLPLHDPVKVAEQVAVLDLISNGRAVTAMGAGYVKSEFAMFRRSTADRAKLLDEGLPLIIRALKGERFKDKDREVFIRPLPLRKPEDIVMVAGGVPAVAKRAARVGLGMYPMSPDLIAVYNAECAKLGKKPGPIFMGGPTVHVSEDPDRTWAQVAPHVMHVVNSYAKFAEGTTSSSPFVGITTPEQVRATGIYCVVTPDECVKMSEDMAKAGAHVTVNPVVGGLDPKIGWESLELLDKKVLPRLKAKAA
jgi:alkanesulfonate monooxygenase SsuD/methylene tetrahydromethanopterin reductase-like flavin-dependent oxidoreductase (luciferase family)